MADEISQKLYKYVKTFHEKEDYANYVQEIDCQNLIPKLRLYQENAVKWMMYKENGYDKNVLPKEFEDFEVIYPKGGILADEMGLGKTVEMLALILNNQYVDDKSDILADESDCPMTIDDKINVNEDAVKEEYKSEEKTEKEFLLSKSEFFESIDNSEKVESGSVILNRGSEELIENENEIFGSGVNSEKTQNESVLLDRGNEELIGNIIKKEVEIGCVEEVIETKMRKKNKSCSFVQYNYDGYSEDDNSDYRIESDEDYVPEEKEAKKKSEATAGQTRARRKKKRAMTSDSDSEELNEVRVERVQTIKTNVRRKRKLEIVNDSDSDEEFCLKKKRKVSKKQKSTPKKGKKAKVPNGKKSAKGETYKYLSAWYEQALSQVKVQTKLDSDQSEDEDDCDSGFKLKCHCSSFYNYETIQCEACRYWQHIPCVGVDSFKPKKYYCPSCWVKREPIKSRATFIVSPDSIVHQWQDEIKRHVKKDGLKVLNYQGAKGGNYIQPEELADFDIVISTYSVLCRELNYCGEREERRLRYKKKFHAITSPLTVIRWWRLCLDEAQMVESPTTKTAEMARALHSNYKWAVTGTPIQKSLNDLYGLMEFFGMSPFTESRIWNALVRDEDALHYYIGHLLWRSQKEDVYQQLGVPPQTVLTHWLKFTPVEGYFYQRTHNECTTHFREKLSRVKDLNVTLTSLDRAFVNRMLQPLLRLRQACIHPQAVNGKFRNFKGTMTMEELLTAMINKVKQGVDVAVRTLVASLNGQAGIKILLGEWNDAIALYRCVLQLQSNYPKTTIKLDTLQKLHTLYNLSKILKECHTAAPTLHDDTLGDDALKVEQEYLQKYENAVVKEKLRLAKLGSEVEKLSGGKPLGYSDWWKTVITESDDYHDIVYRVRTQVLDQHTKFPIKASYSNKIKNIESLYGELATWLAELDNTRLDIIKHLAKLQDIDTTTLCQQALCCHLRNIGKSKKKCQLCKCENILLNYEAMIFEVTKQDQEGRKKNMKCLLDSDLIEEAGSSKTKEAEELESAQLLATKKEGNWKPSQMERIIQVLVSYAKQKKYPPECIQDGNSHLTVLEAVRKEFKSLRALWTFISDQVAAYDELSMAKLRFRLPLPDEIKDVQKRKIKEAYIIQEHEILPHLEKLQHERILAEKDVSKNIGVMMYLLNLQKEPNQERDPCPICREPINDKWSVLQCGHCYCFDCIPSLLKNMNSVRIECAICREKTKRDEVAYVDCSKQTNYDDHEFNVRGSHSTKVEAVIVETLKLKAKDPKAKILIFSTWEKVLDVVGEAFDDNEILYKRLTSNKTKSKQFLEDFKVVEGVTALLLPLKLGSKGLNLVEATHVFFVEPIINPGDELQAVGRVHRIGQTKQTYVHRFVIHNTIEERMLTSLDSSSDEWTSDKVTVQHLHSLFSLSKDTAEPLVDNQTQNQDIAIDSS